MNNIDLSPNIKKPLKKKKHKKSKKISQGFKVGRPSDYRPEYAQMMIDYFNRVPYTVKGKKEIPADYPTIEGFACKIMIAPKNLRDWTDKHEEFRTAYEYAKSKQKEILIANGIRGNYNTLFAKFVAINATDMRERVDVEHSGEITIIKQLEKLSLEELNKLNDKYENGSKE